MNFEPTHKLEVRNGSTYFGRISRLKNVSWEGWQYTDRGEEVPQEVIENFYYLDLWCPLWCHLIDDQEVAWSLFDYSLTSGYDTAIRTIQKVVQVKQTGNMGPDTLEMINCWDETELLLKVVIARCFYYLKEQKNIVKNITRALAAINNPGHLHRQ